MEIIKNIFVSMKIDGTNSRLLSTPPWNEAFDHFQHCPHQSRLVFLMAPNRPIENQVSKFWHQSTPLYCPPPSRTRCKSGRWCRWTAWASWRSTRRRSSWCTQSSASSQTRWGGGWAIIIYQFLKPLLALTRTIMY